MTRRRFTKEFKVSAVALVRQQGLSIREAAERLGVCVSSLRFWLHKYQEDAPAGSGVRSAGDLQAENRRLREENARLKMEREILKKATAFFARES